MKSAKDYIAFPLDVPDMSTARELIEQLSGVVGMFKVGLELFIEAGPEIVRYIQSTGGTPIFLDLKLHDIPATVGRAVTRIGDMGVSFATVHCGESEEMLAVAVQAADGRVGILGVTVLTSIGPEHIRQSGFEETYSEDPGKLVLKRAAMAKSAGCAGVICSPLEARIVKEQLGSDFLAVTPGIRPGRGAVASDDQRRAATPASAIRAGADILVIGRPIRDAGVPRDAAIRIAEEIEGALQG
ncbi:Orotidine 5'-phosphate decarboxylase (EC [Olavius algarvensis associated proteobacterium Delta 3]|nr:Orotidine 5'-phosphate decarboxylase (EC [Olavius algarvensis associated proteobacterium Delta 3]CAB5102847.1 Orotidine 5'-phosphate decarboxylase (EC [Olavius algarvensis associated proteobacterium Delta 3]